MQISSILKLIGQAILVMILLIVMSFIEVAVYSYLINPGQPVAVYEAHANNTAPYVSGLFGFLLFFLFARRARRKADEGIFKSAFLLPITYVLLDSLIYVVSKIDWSTYWIIFVTANGLKFLGSYVGYIATGTEDERRNKEHESIK